MIIGLHAVAGAFGFSGKYIDQNIAWLLRRLPVFDVFGEGNYKLRPIYVDDLAALAVEQGERRGNAIIETVGPETFAYRGLVETIGKTIGKQRLIIPVPPVLGFIAGRIIGRLVGDMFVTRDEIEGLMAGLLYVDAPPAGRTKLTDWSARHADALGRKYASELARRFDRKSAYGGL
jgi:nucleoside-diphosphate-sugar epimerase